MNPFLARAIAKPSSTVGTSRMTFKLVVNAKTNRPRKTPTSRSVLILAVLAVVALTITPAQPSAPLSNYIRFPCSVVYYNFDFTVGASERLVFQQAAANWEAQVGVHFVEGIPPPSVRSWLTVAKSFVGEDYTQIAFPIGYGANLVKLSFNQPVTFPGSPNGGVLGTTLHELGHVLGLAHEHKRTDRDSQIVYDAAKLRDGLQNDPGIAFQFAADSLPFSSFVNPYDYGSIMHYGAWAGAKYPFVFNEEVLRPVGPDSNEIRRIVTQVMGAHIALTGQDLAGARFWYPIASLNLSVSGNTSSLARVRSKVYPGGGGGPCASEVQLPRADRDCQNCPNVVFPKHETVELEAVPGSDSIFDVWEGSLSSELRFQRTIRVRMDVDRTISAKFIKNDPPPDDPACWSWNEAQHRWEWICPGDPKPCWGADTLSVNCRRKPPNGCWHWDYVVKAWVYDPGCGGDPSTRDPNPPVTGGGTIAVAGDPNDKLGAKGSGTARYLAGTEPLRYSVLFENVPTASAPAAVVVIKDVLNPSSVDLSTLRLGPITLSGQTITPPSVPLSSLGAYVANVDLRPAQQLGVRVAASLDITTGMLAWTFTTLDPRTSQPPDDPLAGFLAPAAEGSVSFSVALKPGASTGAQISNKATIVFDANAPMDTPVWSNTIDSNVPTSRVSTLPSSQSTSCFRPQWSGSDVGAGVQNFSIFVSDNGGPYTAWLTNTAATSALFNGQPGHTYAFYSRASDRVGNVESAKTAPEATTAVGATATCNGRPSLSGIVSNKSSAGGIMTLGVQLTNTGVGSTQAVTISQIAFRTITGTGAVTLAGPALPLNAGSLGAGGSTTVTLTLNVPSTVKQFSITEQGTLQDLAGASYSFAIAQTVIP